MNFWSTVLRAIFRVIPWWCWVLLGVSVVSFMLAGFIGWWDAATYVLPEDADRYCYVRFENPLERNLSLLGCLTALIAFCYTLLKVWKDDPPWPKKWGATEKC